MHTTLICKHWACMCWLYVTVKLVCVVADHLHEHAFGGIVELISPSQVVPALRWKIRDAVSCAHPVSV